MKKTRYLSLLLAAVMLFALAACSSNKPESSASHTSAISSEAAPVTDKESSKDDQTEPPEPNTEYIQAMVANMSLEEKVGQMFLVAVPDENAVETAKQYHLGGYILFGKDVENKTKDELTSYITGIQNEQKIKMLVAADEEGGTVVRVSSNPNLSPSPFLSPKEYFKNGGMDAVIKAESDKADLLLSLGINTNLAPVCDITKNPDSFMYDRSFADNKNDVCEFVTKTVETYKDKKIGSVLKHFPGYGDNADTHTGEAVDSRSYSELASNDFAPFEAGIKAGADAIMVSHNKISAIDPNSPASLSNKVHTVIKDDLDFKGVIMTDDLSMDAISQNDFKENPAVLAVKAENDIICCADFADGYNAVIQAVNNQEIPIEQIDLSVTKILKWKQNLGILGF